MFELGGWYLTGASDASTDFHLIQSDSEASRWVSLAAEGGLGKAMFAMGYFCEMGIGGEKDVSKAVEWYKRAEKSDDKEVKEKATKKLGELELGSVGGSGTMGSGSTGRNGGSEVRKKKKGKCVIM